MTGKKRAFHFPRKDARVQVSDFADDARILRYLYPMLTDLDHVEFAENPDPRCPCVLLLDVSSSMHGESIAALNDGLKAFQQDVTRDAVAARRVEIAIVTFSSGART